MTHYFTWNNPRILLMCILLLTSTVLLFPTPDDLPQEDKPLLDHGTRAGSCNGAGEPPGSGDWVVLEDTYCHNITLTLYGNLTVWGPTGGPDISLVLDNVTLIVDTAWNMTFWSVGNNTANERYAVWHINNTEIRRPYDIPLSGDDSRHYSLYVYGGIRAIHSNISSMGQWRMYGTSTEDRYKYFYNNTLQQSSASKYDYQLNLPQYGVWDKIRFDNNNIWDNHTQYATQYWLRTNGGTFDFHFGNNTMHCGAPMSSFCPFTNRDPAGGVHYHSWANRLYSSTPDYSAMTLWSNFPDGGYDHFYELAKVVVFDMAGSEITEPITVTNGWGATAYAGNSGLSFWVESKNLTSANNVQNWTMNPYTVSLDNYDYVKDTKFNGSQLSKALIPPGYTAFPDFYNQLNITGSRFWRMDQRKVMYRWDDLGYCVAYQGPVWYPNATMQEHIGHVEEIHDNLTGSDVISHAVVPAHQNCPNYPVELSEDPTWMTFINGLNGSFTDHSYAHINPSTQTFYQQGQHINASYNWSVAYLPERFYTWTAPSSNWNNYTEQHIGNEFSYSKDYIILSGEQLGSYDANQPQPWNGKGSSGLRYTWHSVGFTSWVAGDNYPSQKWAFLNDFASYPLYENFWTAMNHWWQMDNYADGSYNWTKWDEWNQSMLWIDNMNVDYYTMNAYAKWSKNIEDVAFSYVASEDRYYADCTTCAYDWTVKFTNPTTWANPKVWDITNIRVITWTSNYTEMVFTQQPSTEYMICDGCSYETHQPSSLVCDFSADVDGYTVFFETSCNRDDALILHWVWDFGDGRTLYDDDNTTEHDYSQAGSYNVTLEVIDHDGRTALVSKVITLGEENSTSGLFWSGMRTFCWLWGAIILMVILAALVRQRRKKEET